MNAFIKLDIIMSRIADLWNKVKVQRIVRKHRMCGQRIVLVRDFGICFYSFILSKDFYLPFYCLCTTANMGQLKTAKTNFKYSNKNYISKYNIIIIIIYKDRCSR